MINVGFTGTRDQHYITNDRFNKLVEIFNKIDQKYGPIIFHHGTCHGADLTAAIAFRKLFPIYKIVEHPPIIKKYSTSLKDRHTDVCVAKDYLTRNKDIVNQSQLLIAWPKDKDQEELRSGTWSTVRYARKTNTKIIFV